VRVDLRAAQGLLEESRDLHADAMNGMRATLPELAEIGETRRAVLAKVGLGLGGVVAGMLASPAGADTALDVQILQTASSLEALAMATYGAALGQGPDRLDAPAYRAVAGMPVQSARDVITAFAMETMRQHAEHKKAFQAQTSVLDRTAKVQDGPNPKFLPVVDSSDVSTVDKLVDLATLVERVATDTYLTNLTMVQDPRTKTILAGVIGVEAQHLATLRTISALLKAGTPQLVAVPFPAKSMKDLPQVAGTAATPDALHTVNGPDLLAEPTSGAVR
jgi:hypothetical protein